MGRHNASQRNSRFYEHLFFCIVFLYMSAAWVARNDIKLSANWLTKMYDFLGCQKVTSPVSKHICIPYYQGHDVETWVSSLRAGKLFQSSKVYSHKPLTQAQSILSEYFFFRKNTLTVQSKKRLNASRGMLPQIFLETMISTKVLFFQFTRGKLHFFWLMILWVSTDAFHYVNCTHHQNTQHGITYPL